METGSHMPAWEAFEAHNERDAAELVGIEAVQRLLLKPVARVIEHVDGLIAAALPDKTASAMADFYSDLAGEALVLGLRLGRALAQFNVPGDPERSLATAIAAAGLIGYELPEALTSAP